MRRVAAELGAGTMTLYHYVRTKDELLALVDNAVMGELLIPPDEVPEGWRAGMREIAHRTRATFVRHPWIVEMPKNIDSGPNGSLHFEQSLAVMARPGCRSTSASSSSLLVDDYVFGYIQRFTPIDALAGENPEELVEQVRRRGRVEAGRPGRRRLPAPARAVPVRRRARRVRAPDPPHARPRPLRPRPRAAARRHRAPRRRRGGNGVGLSRPLVGSGHGDDGEQLSARAADRRGREEARPLLVVGAGRDQPDRGRGRRGQALLGLRRQAVPRLRVAARQRLDRLRPPEGRRGDQGAGRAAARRSGRRWRPSRARGSGSCSPRSRPATCRSPSSRTAAPRPTRTRSSSRAGTRAGTRSSRATAATTARPAARSR